LVRCNGEEGTDFLAVHFFFTFSFTCIMTKLLQCKQKMHALRYNRSNALISKLLHVSGLSGPSSGSAQLHKTMV
jgi:hypothetical protein